MRVRCWVIVGGLSTGLLEEMFVGSFAGAPPEASGCSVGQWCYWQAASDGPAIKLVCVELPL